VFERFEVGDDLPCVLAEDWAAGDPEHGAEEEPAGVAAEGALPHHLDPAATLGWRRGELPEPDNLCAGIHAEDTAISVPESAIRARSCQESGDIL
jgi:hypothetical protein